MRPTFRLVGLFVLLVMNTGESQGQRIRFTDTTNKWAMVYFDLQATATMHSRYAKDTLISGNNYHRLVTSCFYSFPEMALARREETLAEKI